MASNNSLLIFSILSFIPVSTNYPTFTSRNAHPILNFDKDTPQYADFEAIMPQHYSGNNGFSIYLTFGSDVIVGDVVWSCKIDNIGIIQNIDSDSFAAPVDNIIAVPGISELMAISQHDFTSNEYTDSITAGDCFRLRISRTADSTNDTANGVSQLYLVEFREI